jgi:hypothetical protein
MKSHGVDLDGTLATYYDGEYEPGKIGDSIPLMFERVRAWLAAGERVDVFTARVHPSHGPEEVDESMTAIKEWFKENFGVDPIVTCQKDPKWEDHWDDKAVRVVRDKGFISDQTEVDEPLVEDADGIGEFLG